MPSSTRTTASSPTSASPRPQHQGERPDSISGTIPHQRLSALEQSYGPFYETTIEAIDRSYQGGGRLVRDLNRIHDIVAGLGTVLRIEGGNCALEDEFVHDAPESTPPLSRVTEYQLTAMAAAICEQMRDDLEHRADSYNARVSA